jgi:excisionase family DNA binding protein
VHAREFPATPVSVKEAASRLHVSKDTIRRRIAAGELTAYRLGPKIVRVDMGEVEKLFRRIPTTGTAEESA